MKNRLKYIAILIFIFQSNVVFCQQEIQQYSKNGLTTFSFETTIGEIKLYVPELTANEFVSGTVQVYPMGDSARKQEKNLNKLQQYSFSIGGITVSITSKSFGFLVPDNELVILRLMNDKGVFLAETKIEKK